MEYRRSRRRRDKYARRRKILYVFLMILFLIPISTFALKYIGGAEASGTATATSYKVSGNVNNGNQNTAQAATSLEENTKAATLSKESNKVTGSSEQAAENTAEASSLSNPLDLVPGTGHGKMADAYAYSTEQVRKWMRHEEPYTGGKLVFLTFDDGPNTTITPKVLDTLKAEGVHATFFVVGKNINEKTTPMLIREIKEGHTVANHSLTHNYKVLYPGRVADANEVLYEVNTAEEILQKALGADYKSSVFRYPGGHMSWKQMAGADEALAKRGTQWMDWNVSIGDAVKGGAKASVETLLANVKAGVAANKNKDLIVLLMHDEGSKQGTAAALPSVIQYFKSEGYQFGILK